jgi:hypothetical protein
MKGCHECCRIHFIIFTSSLLYLESILQVLLEMKIL